MKLRETIRQKLRNFLWLEPSQGHSINIQELYDFDANAFRNRMWVRGDPYELEQFFKNSGASNACFWAAVPQIPIHKLHSGLPSMMVNVMSSIVGRDYDGMDVSGRETDWEAIEKDNDFFKLLNTAIKETITIGDGAFKISNDPALSEYPIIEFFPGDRVDYVYRRGRLLETVFKTSYRKPTKGLYVLYEHYGWGYIRYVLRDAATGDPVGLDTLEETAALYDVGLFGYQEDEKGVPLQKSNVMLAVPLLFQDSSKWPGRGESLIDKKEPVFDTLDEIISQWSDAVRAGRPIRYIPSCLSPRNADGLPMPPNSFDNAYIKIGDDMSENGKNEINVVQPEIKSENYLQAYMTFLDLCLQGFMSPSTLGIDTKKLDNAEAQREKEKTTLYTRNIIIDALQKTLPKLVNAAIMAYDAFNGRAKPSSEIDVNVNFGEYASPSFEALVEVLTKAKTANLMSVETLVEELYGDSKDDEWKAEEVKRLKEELGIGEPLEDDGLENIEGGTGDDLSNQG